jgi:phosphatidylethanolamine/phosphatidyl-N-methylethanolamine N-methyltransferase
MTPNNSIRDAAGAAGFDSALRFIGAFIREPFAVGALCPSSPVLARAVVDSCDFEPDDTVVELGPGTGAFTRLLLKRLDKRGQLLALETSDSHVEMLRRTLPRCRVIHDSAEHLARYLPDRRADCIVSGLAWANMLPRMQDRILKAVWKSLSPQGQFIAFAYAHALCLPTSLRFRRLLSENFVRVETTPIVWRNLPPAYIYRCWLTPAKPNTDNKTSHDSHRHRRRSRQRD